VTVVCAERGVERQARLAFSVIVVPASARDTGHWRFVSSAIALNFAESMPGTFTMVESSIFVMVKPAPSLSRWTSAAVRIDSGGLPGLSERR
jgi:hypothetical protein